MKVGILQLNATVGDFSGNRERLLEAYARACSQGAELVVAPEMFVCGYPPRDLLLRPDFVQHGIHTLEKIAAGVGAVPLCVGYVDFNHDRPGKPLFNTAAFLHNGVVAHKRHKTLLPAYDVFEEDRYFEPARDQSPIEFNGWKIALTVCEDIWNDQDFWPDRLYRRDPVCDLVAQGANLILNLSASPWQRGKESQRLDMLRKVAADEKTPLVYVNLVGGNDELIFDGHSLALNSDGNPVFSGRGFEEEIAVVDIAAKSSVQVSYSSLEEQTLRALTLGLRDYVHKCGFHSVVLGLSGGIDSALVAVLAARALGSQNVLGVSMPSRYSSPGSITDAQAVAKNLGIRYDVIPIDTSVHALEGALQRSFSGKTPDITEENIQSRLRGLLLMALSNKFSHLVLTTGNKSELAVGYCTLYGDMCGALAVIEDLFKTEIYQLAHWINKDTEVIPTGTIVKPPSAELRPNQTDQDTLPPYEILDAILRAYLLEEKSFGEILKMGFAPETVREIIHKINSSEYKRRQAAPGLKVSARAFGMGRRIPVAQKYRGGESQS
jgi:NAD+ synthetase